MLITLCYLYLWARRGPRSAALVRGTVRRLHRSRCSFTFCARQPLPGERVCLRVGGKVFCTGEAQVEPRACAPGRGGCRGDGRCASLSPRSCGERVVGVWFWGIWDLGVNNARRELPRAVTAAGEEQEGRAEWVVLVGNVLIQVWLRLLAACRSLLG